MLQSSLVSVLKEYINIMLTETKTKGLFGKGSSH